MFVLYDLLVNAAVWLLLLPWELARFLFGRAGWNDVAERLGIATRLDARRRRVVVHAVSAGEVMAARPLILELERRHARVVLTVTNRAGRAMAEALQLSGVERVVWIPWDRRGALRRWLRALRVEAVVVIETELWPNLFRACHDEGLRLVIANGRLLPQDVRRYRLARRFFSRVLANATHIGVQSEEERGRFIAIGAAAERVSVLGNLKVDAALETATATQTWRAPLIVAGSTHAGEEELVLAAFAELRERVRDAQLVIVPRDVARSSRIAQLARERGLEAVIDVEPAGAVTVVDRVGLLRELYALASIAIVGGTLVPIGGHNVLEPIAQGSVTIVGPHTDNVDAMLQPFVDAGAVIVVRDASELSTACTRLLTDSADAERVRSSARTVLETMPRCAARYADLIVPR